MDDTLLGIIVIIFIMCGTTIISIINIFRNGLKYGELEKNFKKLEKEKIEIKQNYPRVKLVYGEEKIFYIPTDLQYDNISFGSTNKEYDRAFTCKEAEEKGYRHCYKWRGN